MIHTCTFPLADWHCVRVLVAASRVLNTILYCPMWIGLYVHQNVLHWIRLTRRMLYCMPLVNRECWCCSVCRCGGFRRQKICSSCISNLSCAWAIRKKCYLTNSSPPYLSKSNSTYNSWLIRQQLQSVILFF